MGRALPRAWKVEIQSNGPAIRTQKRLHPIYETVFAELSFYEDVRLIDERKILRCAKCLRCGSRAIAAANHWRLQIPVQSQSDRHQRTVIADLPFNIAPQIRPFTTRHFATFLKNTMRPWLKATLQAAVVSAVSNVLGQLVEAYRSNVSRSRAMSASFNSPQGQRPLDFNVLDLIRFIVLHLCTAPPNYKWQELLERNFPARPSSGSHSTPEDRDLEKNSENRRPSEDAKSTPWRPKRPASQHGEFSYRNTLIKWFIDCITIGALMNTTAFLIIMGLLKGQSWHKISDNLRNETLVIIVNGWKLWPIASAISFSFIPVERRILFFSCIGLCWNIYMTLVAARL